VEIEISIETKIVAEGMKEWNLVHHIFIRTMVWEPLPATGRKRRGSP
jgi:hypothetical protein